MKKLLRTQDKILTGLALFGDLLLESYTRSHGFGWNKSWSEALSLNNSTFRSGISRLQKTGDIEKVVDKKGNVCYKLSSPGIERYERLYPLSRLSNKPWDGKWRIVIFDIEEENKKSREYLRFKLNSLGFGKLQDSVYVSPLDVLADFKEYLKSEGLSGQVIVFEARELAGFNDKSIANFVWHLDKINKEYDDLIWEAKETLDNKKKEELKEKYFQILLKDPQLPKEFLPDDWLGDKAKLLMIKTVLL